MISTVKFPKILKSPFVKMVRVGPTATRIFGRYRQLAALMTATGEWDSRSDYSRFRLASLYAPILGGCARAGIMRCTSGKMRQRRQANKETKFRQILRIFGWFLT